MEGIEVWDEKRIKAALTRLPTDLYVRHPLWSRDQVVELIASRLAKKWKTQLSNKKAQRVPSLVRILFLAANPIVEICPGASETPLALDDELREIGIKIRASEHRESLELVSRVAVRPDDLIQAFNELRPHVVHFSGHGTETEELILLNDQRQPQSVSTAAIEALFKAMRDNIRVVVLNACYSKVQASAITRHVDCAIGMNREIGDNAAITFAASFYRAIGFGRSIKEAFEQGLVALKLANIAEDLTPKLLCRKGVNPSKIKLIAT